MIRPFRLLLQLYAIILINQAKISTSQTLDTSKGTIELFIIAQVFILVITVDHIFFII